MVSMNHIRQAVETVAPAFPIKKVELFGPTPAVQLKNTVTQIFWLNSTNRRFPS